MITGGITIFRGFYFQKRIQFCEAAEQQFCDCLKTAVGGSDGKSHGKSDKAAPGWAVRFGFFRGLSDAHVMNAGNRCNYNI